MYQKRYAKPTLVRLFASLFYEAMTVVAIAFVAAALFVTLFGDASVDPLKRWLMQSFIWLIIGAYYVISWVKRGQSLAMRSWQLQLTSDHTNQSNISLHKATLRYILATFSLFLGGVGFLSGFVLPQRKYLHDYFLDLKIDHLNTKD